jgi:hypothetical protein
MSIKIDTDKRKEAKRSDIRITYIRKKIASNSRRESKIRNYLSLENNYVDFDKNIKK